MTVIEGVDYSFDVPTPAQLKAAGKKFAVRYGGPGSAGKQLTASELRGLTAAGIAVVANAEGAAGGFRGAVAGRSWAASAETDFATLGMPDDRPIYFSVDWDAGGKDWANIDAALKGAASVIGASRVGVYGSYDVVRHCQSAGTAQWFWQTYAWSAGKWASGCHLQQYKNGVKIGGHDVDLTRAVQDDYGQWGVVTDVTDVTVDLSQNVPDSPYATKRGANGIELGAFIADQENLRDFLTDPEGTIVTGLGGYAAGYPADSSNARIALLLSRVKGLVDQLDDVATQVDNLAAKIDALAGWSPVITQAQLDLALLNALKTLAGGQS